MSNFSNQGTSSTTKAEQQIDGILRNAILRSIELNECGIQYLKKHQFDSSIEQFGSALSTLNQVLASCQESSTLHEERDIINEPLPVDQQIVDGADVEQQEDCAENIDMCQNSTIITDERPPIICIAGSLSSDNLTRHQSNIYTKPIYMKRFLPLASPKSFISYVNIVEMSISVMFNFALAHHLSATSGDVEDPTRVFDQAIALYELTHSLQLQEGIELSVEYTMATICNLGHIHQLLGDVDKSSKCFEHLLSIFFFLQSQNAIDQHEQGRGSSSITVAADASSAGNGISSIRKLLDTDVFFDSVSPFLLSNPAAPAA